MLESYKRPSYLRKAWNLQKNTAPFNRWTVFFGVLVYTLGSILYYFLAGGESLKEELLPSLFLGGPIAVIIALAIILVINFVRAPYVINKEQSEIIRGLENELSPERISARVSHEAYEYPNPDGTYYGAIRLTNQNESTLTLKANLMSVLSDADGFQRDLKNEINEWESRLSWKGGSDDGREMIEPGVDRSLHIAFVEDQSLKWVFQKGTSPYESSNGIYKIEARIMGDMVGRPIEPIRFIGRLRFDGGDELKFTEWSESMKQEKDERTNHPTQ